jgi:hypothetical protein
MRQGWMAIVAKLGRKGGAVVIAAPMSTKRLFIAAIRQMATPAETKRETDRIRASEGEGTVISGSDNCTASRPK